MTQRDQMADLAFRKALSEFWPTTRFFGLGLLLVLVLGQWLRFVAVIGIGAFGLLLLWNVIRTLIALGLGAILLVSGTSATSRGTEAKVWATKALLVVETIVYGFFVLVLYWFFFAKQAG